MDKLKNKLAISALWHALEQLEAAIQNYDHRQIGAQLYRIKQEVMNLQNNLGVVRDLEDLKFEPSNLPRIEIVSAAEIDPDVLEEIETQLLSAELDEQGNPRITFHANGDKLISELVDEETLEMLDADWDEAKAAGTG